MVRKVSELLLRCESIKSMLCGCNPHSDSDMHSTNSCITLKCYIEASVFSLPKPQEGNHSGCRALLMRVSSSIRHEWAETHSHTSYWLMSTNWT